MTWADVARAQDGVMTRTQLRSGGLSDSAIDRMLRSGALERRARSVFLVRGAPLTYRAQLWVATLGTRGSLALGTAAHLWGAVELAPQLVHVVVTDDRHVTGVPDVLVHRLPVPARALQHHAGFPVTSRSWTVLDHVGRLRPHDALRLADRALQCGWITLDDVQHRLAEFPGRTGNTRLREVLATCGDGAAAHSERVLHRLLRRSGAQGWVANHPVWADGQLVGVADIALPELKLAIEVDGMAFHIDVDRFQRDRTRQNALVALGWTVLRFTWADLTQRPAYVVATVRRHLRQLRDRGVHAS